ncbi:hypothetical protein MVLG_05961 [Microbotryum lychnidis-dioicae p1A1 Lamole]|uniref:Xylose isomerase-like TIM barrel domain-containing protein n=1 Tax=Microbotryum lychnidis-dioicae (strain p1A1 Lamole / MvSl-1064) TaxID=683840 RepID=U5HFT5_USTV1|nr:hypothetical protein MVLG_05961 [Microbotryum lychnidis-dioicae p1A1 Lamole]|eukprot:KDE03576.1 hypothetical protein MVLG_05961 [Microbotryum lychnidis-dioicae p1A1 Lamole]
MACVVKYGKPLLFITVTCNPEWPEIKAALGPNDQACNRPELIARAFESKLNRLCDDDIFGNKQRAGSPTSSLFHARTRRKFSAADDESHSGHCLAFSRFVRAPHLAEQIAAAAQAGFQHIELFDDDWAASRDSWSEAQGLSKSTRDGDSTSQFAAAALADLVRSYGLRISCWQPLRTFEGYVDAEDRRKSREFARGILDILPILGTRLLLCCTTTTPAPATTGDLHRCAEDLVWLADEAAKCDPPVRVMYEGLSFAAHRRSWQSAWEVVENANRPNLGLCLDSFNTLALEWADPYSSTGRLSPDVDEKLQANMRELVQRVPGHKIFFYQVADGRFMSPPMTPPTDPSIPPIRPWSRRNRLFPFENELGAYLPVSAFSDAVVQTGYDGPWSLESLTNPSRAMIPMSLSSMQGGR